MATPVGLRTVVVFKDASAGATVAIGRESGSIVFAEVTNNTASDVDFVVNNFPAGGVAGVAIPIPANSTRQLPLQLYNFTPSGVVTVVAYGM